MPPRRAVPRTLTPQVVEQDVGVDGFIRKVATAVRQRNQVVSREDRSSLLEKFVKLRPTMFRGKSDTLEPEGWIKKLFKIFEAIPDERKLTLISFILEDEAEFWWDMIARTDDYESIDAVMELDPSTSNMVV